MEALTLEKEQHQRQQHNMLQTETAWPFPWKSCLIHFALFVTAELNNHAQEVFSWLYRLAGFRFWHKNPCLSTFTHTKWFMTLQWIYYVFSTSAFKWLKLMIPKIYIQFLYLLIMLTWALDLSTISAKLHNYNIPNWTSIGQLNTEIFFSKLELRRTWLVEACGHYGNFEHWFQLI